MREDRMVLSRRIQVIDGDDTAPGLLLFHPVYDLNKPRSTPEERTAGLRGWVYSSLRIDRLMADLPETTDGQLAIEIFEGEKTSPQTLLHAIGGGHMEHVLLAIRRDANPRSARAALDRPNPFAARL